MNLLTFNLDDYNITGSMKVIASLVFVMVLLSMLIAIGINHPTVLIIAGIAGILVAGQEFFGEIESFFDGIIQFFVGLGENLGFPDFEIDMPDWTDVSGWWPW